MKKLILISALLFSFNGWAEQLYFACECEKLLTNVIIDPNGKRNNLNWMDEGCLTTSDNFSAIVNTDNKTISLGNMDPLPIKITKSEYIAQNCGGNIEFKSDDYENICYSHVLNRITLYLKSEAPAWWHSDLRGRYRSFNQCEFKQRY